MGDGEGGRVAGFVADSRVRSHYAFFCNSDLTNCKLASVQIWFCIKIKLYKDSMNYFQRFVKKCNLGHDENKLPTRD